MTKIRSFITPALAVDTATLGTALVIAEQLYKFHSFTLEALAFLGTWYSLRKIASFFLPRR